MRKNKPAIIILHGWGLSAARFGSLGDALRKEGYRVFIPDLPGFGESILPNKPYRLADYALFLHEYIQEKKLSNVVLIGHSFGGRVSLRYSDMYPDNISGLILTGTPGVTPVPRRKLLVFIALAKAGKLILSVWPFNFMQEKIRLWYYYLVGAREFYRAEGVMRETFKHIVQEDLISYMHNVHVPTLLAWGAMDQITPLWIAQRMRKEMTSSTLIVIPDKGHGVPFKEPDIFVRNIMPFLRQL